MPSVSEQLHLYRALKAREEAMAGHHPAHAASVKVQHPSTKDFFKLLMLRWQKDYMKNHRS